MKVIESVRCMQNICMQLASERHKSIRLVATMGALHDGHGSLIERARRDTNHVYHDDDDGHNNVCRSNCVINYSGEAGILTQNVVVIVSIFVNPNQFNDLNDFVQYPQTRDSDLAMCRKLNVDYVFMPMSKEIYGGPTHRLSDMCFVKPSNWLACQLEGCSRPNHFEGMLTIVNKLFNITRPHKAYFGEKDYQQLVLVRRMSEDLNIIIEICPIEIVREQATGLPMSSRNSRLSLKQKHLAAKIMTQTLISTARLLEHKCVLGSQQIDLNATLIGSLIASQLMLDIETTLFTNNDDDDDDEDDRPTISIDYFELRCAKDLTMISYNEIRKRYDCQLGCCGDKVGGHVDGGGGDEILLEARLLMSILVSKVRLLDNVCVRMNLSRTNCGANDD